MTATTPHHDAENVEQTARPVSPSVAFLQWALPRLGLTWSGFRRVRHQVWHRIGRRLAELHLGGPDEYRAYLMSHPEEWAALESFCRIPISRFLRDREVFDSLGVDVLPDLATRASRYGDGRVRAWSAGCASGEEPYSLVLVWRFILSGRFPGVVLDVLATDVDDALLARARSARYRGSSLREVPPAWRDAAFHREKDSFVLRTEIRSAVAFRRADLRYEMPDETFDLILCRNVVCTYFDEPLQRRTLSALLALLRPGGALVIGKRERLPRGLPALTGWIPKLGIFRRAAALASPVRVGQPTRMIASRSSVRAR